MTTDRRPWAALVRGVNVGGVKVPMAELRELVAGLGHVDVRTLLASGNVVLRAGGVDEAGLAAQLTGAISERWGRPLPVLVRSPEDLRAVAEAEPFGDGAEAKLVQVVVLDGQPAPGAVDELLDRARDGEEVVAGDRALYVWYRGGSARSALTLDRIEAATGCTGTARNRTTIGRILTALDELASA